MPATEQTKYTMNRMHAVFAASGLVLLIATIWMFAKDHDREWKKYQRTADQIEIQMTQWRKLQAATDDVTSEHERLQNTLAEVRSRSLPRETINQFVDRAAQDAQRRGLDAQEFAESLTGRLNTRMEELDELAAAAAAARKQANDLRLAMEKAITAADEAEKAADQADQDARTQAAAANSDETRAAATQAREQADQLKKTAAAARQAADQARAAYNTADDAKLEAELAVGPKRDEIIRSLRTVISAARFREDEALRARKFESATLDAAKANLGLGVRDGLSQAELDILQVKVDELKDAVQTLNLEYQAAAAHRNYLQKLANSLTEMEDDLNKRLEENQAEMQRLDRAVEERRSTYFVSNAPFLGKKWLELPILDAFNSPLKIDNLWSEGLDQQFGSFSRVRRFDRCTTCHQSIDKSMPGTADVAAYPSDQLIQLQLAAPTEDNLPVPSGIDEGWDTWVRSVLDDSELSLEERLTKIYGVNFAALGLLDYDDVTVKFVRPKSLAAGAALESGNGRPELMTDDEIRDTMLQPHKAKSQATIRVGDVFPLAGQLVIRVRGAEGAHDFTFAADGEATEFLTAINTETETTGVEAVESDGQVALRSIAFGPEAFVEVDVLRDFEGRAFELQLSDDLAYGADLSQPQVQPGLIVGDVIVEINGDPVSNLPWAANRLLQAARDREGLQLTVRRGLPNPYASHPRLDLYVGSLSPHDLANFACTVCHEGQGSATEFKWASHAPNSPLERSRWSDQYGWFDNHHWIFPMFAKRFAESGCLKCHHDVTELEASERFPDPPAPKVTHGFDLVRKYGCYGCHEINGYDGSKRVGPDLRLEPNFFAAAQQLKHAPNTGFDQLTDNEQALVDALIDHPERNDVRRQLHALVLQDQERALARRQAEQNALPVEGLPEPRLSEMVHEKLEPLLKDIDTPGTLRKAGPSLRFVGRKLDDGFLYDWIREPTHFRPSTRMPAFFGHWNHLEGEGLQVAEKFEPIEIYSMAFYLQERSQDFEYLELPQNITTGTADEQIERGRIQFQERGCLACHNHQGFPDAKEFRAPDEIVQGPDLSAVADKFNSATGRRWLYSWIKQPSRYHVRTVMPDLYLDPITHRDADGQVTMVTDPVADIVAYLMASSTSDWQPVEFTFDDAQREVLGELAYEHLKDTFYELTADEYRKTGIPESIRDELKGIEVEMVISDAERQQLADDVAGFRQLVTEKQLLYVGRRTMAKYGCYACHDIPGFEDAKPIGTGLADWGRKEPEKLAFEHILQYLHHGGHGGGHHGAGNGHQADGHHEGHHDGPHPEAMPPEFYMQQLNGGNRIGFIFQKLLEPRSYDYHKTENKKYNERLRMPQFNFDNDQREAVVTFVLGLVADPPKPKYIYQPDERSRAIQEGKEVLAKYNCGGCHILQPERLEIAFPEGYYGEQNLPPTYPFVLETFTPDELQASAETDRRNLQRATLTGLPFLADDGRPMVLDDEEFPLEDDLYRPNNVFYSLHLYRPTALGGSGYQVSELPMSIPASHIEKRYAAEGGFLTRYLLPHVVAREKQVNPNAKGSEAWAWLPPPLLGEGEKVQTDWLHDFLLDPHLIRPAVVLRMPKFNMSSDEAAKLVNYFAAVDNVNYPYSFSTQQRDGHLASAERRYADKLRQLAASGEVSLEGSPQGRHLDDAMNIIIDSNYCRKCHLVADYRPVGSDRALAPDLSAVQQRLRTDYVRKWIAKPTSILPYSNMPVNVPYDPEAPFLGTTVAQNLYHGNSVEQLEALVDLLMNYTSYAKQHAQISPLVQQMEAAAAAAAPPATEGTQ